MTELHRHIYCIEANKAALNAFLLNHPIVDIRGGGDKTFTPLYIDTLMQGGEYCSWAMPSSWELILQSFADSQGWKRNTTDSDNDLSIVNESSFTFQQFLDDLTQKPRLLTLIPSIDQAAPGVTSTSDIALWTFAQASVKDGSEVAGLFNLATFIGSAEHVGPQTISANRPLIVTAAQNGLDIVRYNEDGDELETGASQVVSQPFAVFIAGSGRNSDTGNVFAERSGGAACQLRFGGTGRIRLNCGINLQSGTGVNDNSPHVYTVFADGSSSEVFIDGSSFLSGDAGGNSFDLIRLTDGSLDYDFYEMIVLSRLPTAQEQSDIESYLKSKWATP